MNQDEIINMALRNIETGESRPDLEDAFFVYLTEGIGMPVQHIRNIRPPRKKVKSRIIEPKQIEGK